MKKFAMVNSGNNIVIDIIYREETPSYPNTLEGYQIYPIVLEEGVLVELGMLYENDTFSYTNLSSEPIILPIEPYEPTNSEVSQIISDLQADLIIAGVI